MGGRLGPNTTTGHGENTQTNMKQVQIEKKGQK